MQLPGFKRVVDLVTFLGQLHDELVELGEPSFEFFDADHHLGEKLVALLRRIADIEVVDDRLVEQFQLRVEFGNTLDRHQVAGLLLERGTGLVDRREDVGDVVDDCGSLGGVVDLEVADDVDEHLEVGSALVDGFLQRLGVADLRQFLDPGEFLGHLLLIGSQRLGAEQELDTAVRQGVILLGDFLLELVDQCGVDVAEVSQGDDVTADASECGEGVDEVLDRFEPPPADVGDDLASLTLDPRRLAGGVPLDPHHLLELVDRRGGRVPDLPERGGQAAGFLVGDPEEAVEDVGRLLDDVDVEVGVGVLLVDQSEHLVALGHAPHDVLVAHLVQERLLLSRWLVTLSGVGGLPDLDRMVLGRGFLRAEADQFTTVEQREAVTDQGGLDLLLDQVVVEQDVDARIAIVEDVEEVFAVGRVDAAGELHVLQIALEGLVFAGLQVVAVGEDQSVVVGQHDAGVLDRVESHHLLGLLVVDQVPVGILLVGPNLHQDDVAQDRVVDACVVEGLVDVFDGFGVDALATGGVVLDLDRQVPADSLDEDTVGNRDMRVRAGLLHVPRGQCPLESVLRRKDHLVVRAVVDVGQAVVGDRPLERLDVVDRGTDPEDHEQVHAGLEEPREGGVLVVLVDVFEVLAESVVGNQVQRAGGELPVGKTVHGKNVLDVDLGLQPEGDVVAKQQMRADRDHVPRHTVVLGRDPLGSQQRRLDRPECVLAGVVERAQPLAEVLAVGDQPSPNDFVRPTFQLRPVAGCGRTGGVVGGLGGGIGC